MLNFIKKIILGETKKETFKQIDGKVCLVKEWPTVENSNDPWERHSRLNN